MLTPTFIFGLYCNRKRSDTSSTPTPTPVALASVQPRDTTDLPAAGCIRAISAIPLYLKRRGMSPVHMPTPSYGYGQSGASILPRQGRYGQKHQGIWVPKAAARRPSSKRVPARSVSAGLRVRDGVSATPTRRMCRVFFCCWVRAASASAELKAPVLPDTLDGISEGQKVCSPFLLKQKKTETSPFNDLLFTVSDCASLFRFVQALIMRVLAMTPEQTNMLPSGDHATYIKIVHRLSSFHYWV